MCGIFALLQNCDISYDIIKQAFMNGRDRGPEFSTLTHIEEVEALLGFHRLAINGLNETSHQPLYLGNDLIVICNGEIYNYKELAAKYEFNYTTQSDCEAILWCYQKFGIERTIQELDGVFSFVLLDTREEMPRLFIGRDPFGVRPLFLTQFTVGNTKHYAFTSTMKTINDLLGYANPSIIKCEQVRPGTFSQMVYHKDQSLWHFVRYGVPYFSIPSDSMNTENIDYESALDIVRTKLTDAVRKRVIATDRPIACLLSGGLDSSLITSIVVKICKELGFEKQVETYSIGLPNSVDLKYAKMVADYLDTDHTQIIVREQEFLHMLDYTILTTETYDTTTIRASVGNYLVSQFIKNHSDAKVIFNGDGSDEVSGGYLYFHCAPDNDSFDEECRRLLKEIHYFDVLRSDRSISSNGLEARTPFLDKEFVRSYFTIPIELRNHNNSGNCEKYLIRDAFKGYLPDKVLYRTKEAFSDGVSGEKSWFEIIRDHIDHIEIDESSLPEWKNISLDTKEKQYYMSVYQKYYPHCGQLIPHYWMPRFTNATDASARTLDVYSKINKKK